jgi:hypothetical protein
VIPKTEKELASEDGVAIRGAVCIDLNMVIDPKDLRAKADYDAFQKMISAQSNKCPDHNENEIKALLYQLRNGQCDNVEVLLDEFENKFAIRSRLPSGRDEIKANMEMRKDGQPVYFSTESSL